MIHDLTKHPAIRSTAYLHWVRSLPCCGCQVIGRVEAHHNIADRFGSSKSSDLNSLPLCPDCHRELHAGWRRWEESHGSQWMHAMKTIDRAASDGVLEVNTKIARTLG